MLTRTTWTLTGTCPGRLVAPVGAEACCPDSDAVHQELPGRCIPELPPLLNGLLPGPGTCRAHTARAGERIVPGRGPVWDRALLSVGAVCRRCRASGAPGASLAPAGAGAATEGAGCGRPRFGHCWRFRCLVWGNGCQSRRTVCRTWRRLLRSGFSSRAPSWRVPLPEHPGTHPGLACDRSFDS